MVNLTRFKARTRRVVMPSLVILLALGLLRPSHAQASTSPLECTPSQIDYEWEKLDYYELLGLEQPSGSNSVPVDTTAIRKAYRQQAQQWHPDKRRQTSNQATTKGRDNNNAAAKSRGDEVEATARFARISQAYQVLVDQAQRTQYDTFLQYCQRQQQMLKEETMQASHDSFSQSWDSLFSTMADPFLVLEEFLFGREDGIDEDEWFFDLPPRKDLHPVRTIKHQETIRDIDGKETVRVSHTEEYPTEANGQYYFRIVSQDFVRHLDPRAGMSLLPVTQPYLREEGYRSQHPLSNSNTATWSASSSVQSHWYPGDIVTSQSPLLVSPNQRFYAGLSPECELLVMASQEFGEDTVVWSSEYEQTGAPSWPQRNNCYATLRGPHLVVASSSSPNGVLWYSDVEERSQSASRQSSYVVRLDNDGSLVVYRVWHPTTSHENVGNDVSVPSKAWSAVQSIWSGTTQDEQFHQWAVPSRSSSYSSSLAYKHCVYATGPSGCSRIGRRVFQLRYDFSYAIQSTLSKVEALVDYWMDLLLEETDVLGLVRASAKDLGNQIHQSGARMIRKVFTFISTQVRGTIGNNQAP